MDFITDAIAVLKYFGFDNPGAAGGWIVAAMSVVFNLWRINIMDKSMDRYADKVAEVIKAQQEEWRKLVSRKDDMTYDMLETSTKTLTVLTEKVNTLELILLQNGKK